MESDGSLPQSLKPGICLCPKPDGSSPCPHPTSLKSILILFSLLRLGLSSGLLPSGFPTETMYASVLSPTCATCPVCGVMYTNYGISKKYASYSVRCYECSVNSQNAENLAYLALLACWHISDKSEVFRDCPLRHLVPKFLSVWSSQLLHSQHHTKVSNFRQQPNKC